MPSYYNKITIMDGNSVIREIDLSQDTVTSASDIAAGKYGHLNTGERVLGTGTGGGDETPTYETYFDGSVSGTHFYISDLNSLAFSADETWKVTWDGTEYICTTVYGEPWNLYYIGDINLANGGSGSADGEPFLLFNYAGSFEGYAKTSGTHTLKLEKQTSSGGGGGTDTTNPLSGKIAAFTGDSICAGHGYAGGYAGIIGTQNNMTIQNVSVAGGVIAPSGNWFVINTSISSMRSDADYVILEGGGNDANYGTTLGSITSGYTDTLSTTTFAGCFENMLKSAIARFPTAKIGYIFIHKCIPNFDSRVANSYYGIAKAACEKWGIPFLDLNTMAPPLGYISALSDTYTDSGDGIHPNEQGYKLFYVPKIVAWMKTL